ncbi:MAG: putative toxin-antitoxin system toxin component, PIN family [Spartobacteria bacterium]|nr:putative toxin-antitoxin system toxin component, PIN family [Spartobacteria bacterium]
MSKYKAVIDTNILYAGLYSSAGASFRILQLIERGSIIPFLSTTLLFEYEDVLKRNQMILGLTENEIEEILNEICARGECRRIHFLWRPVLSDPKDDHVLELAVAAGCADIITHNITDFSLSSKFGVRIVKPSQLLGELK